MSAPIAEFTTLPPKSARMFAFYDSHGMPGLVAHEAISQKHIPVIVVPVGHGLIGKAMSAHEKLVSLNAALAEQLERTTAHMQDLDDICGGPPAPATIELARENARLIAESKAVQP